MRGLRGKAYTRYQRERIIRRRLRNFPDMDTTTWAVREMERYM